ncbi:MAG: hypothetical protein P1U89_02420 [Verrucomicrobiales bacterium]|nr:hypothetical protein [Verrucomicrobiales bacterium]
MAAIAADSGLPADNYAGYATSLSLVLAQLSPAQLSEVISDGASSAASAPEEAEEPEENDNGSPAPPNDPAVDQALIDMINSGMAPGLLKEALRDASPLSEAVLSGFVAAASDLPAGIVKDVLFENSPLPENVFDAILAGGTSLNSGHIQDLKLVQ